MFVDWVDPLPDREKVFPGNTTNIYEEVYGEQNKVEEKRRDDASSDDPEKLRDWKLFWAVEAKQRTDGKLTTLLSTEVFEELIRFERWLYFELIFDSAPIPGIPAGDPLYGQDLMYDEIPDSVTFFDIC